MTGTEQEEEERATLTRGFEQAPFYWGCEKEGGQDRMRTGSNHLFWYQPYDLGQEMHCKCNNPNK
jgi:hypothetical protein